jgi:tetratricopeptide (TPR) repeat protein
MPFSLLRKEYCFLLLFFFFYSFCTAQPLYDKEDKKNVALSELRLQANQHKQESHYPQYINTLFQIKRHYEEQKDYRELTHVLSEIGDVYYQWGVYEKAVDYYEKACDTTYMHYISPQDKRNISLKNADANHSLQSYGKAKILYEHLYETWENEWSIKEKLAILNRLADILKKTERYQEAIVYEKKALDFQFGNNDSSAIANAYNNLGATFKKINDNVRALSYFQQAFNYYPPSASKQNLAIILLNLGIANQAVGAYGKANDYFHKALDINKKGEYVEETARTYNYIASNHLFLKEYNEAIFYAEAAERIASSRKLYLLKEISCRIQWQAYELQKDNVSALRSYRQYVAVKDTIMQQKKQEEQELITRLREAERLESRIQTLLSENELQQAELNRVQLENKNKSSALELVQRHHELNAIRAKQVQLQQEKEIGRLQLSEQTLIRQSKEKELLSLKENIALENREKLAKMSALHQQNLIKQLEINQKEISLQNAIHRLDWRRSICLVVVQQV